MFYNIPNNRDDNLFIFPGNSTTSASAEYIAGTIPSSASYISMIVIGPGGNGGLGRADVIGTTKGGGGGGGSGGISKAIFRTRVLPSTLHLSFESNRTTISLEPVDTNPANVRIIYANGGGTGATATGTAVAAGGTGASVASSVGTGLPPFIAHALSYSVFGGQAGGGSAGISPGFMLSGTYCLHGGAAGGSTTITPAYGNGGNIVSSVDFFPSVAVGTGSGSGKGGDGANGTWFWKPYLLGLGGGGGGAGSTLPGRGGDGAYGCGGGGGGSCVTSDPEAYGRGGPGLIILKCF